MTTFAMCVLTAVPVRHGASHRAEMGSQLLFGELVEVLEQKNSRWAKIRSCEDNFVGWIPSLQLRYLNDEEYQQCKSHHALVLDLFHALMGDNQSVPLTLGAHLPGFDGMQFFLGEHRYTFSGQAVFPEDVRQPEALMVKTARRLLNVPFLWGGRTPMGIDGPGLVQLACKVAGIPMPRLADQQLTQGQVVDFVEQSRAGDVAFFENNHGRITHSGILLGGGDVIHAFEKVRIDTLDHYGIYNKQMGRYTHRLRIIKRLVPEPIVVRPVKGASAAAAEQIALF